MQQVPTLALEDGDQMHYLAQSIAIMEYLEETHPSPALLPKEPAVRARVRQLAECVNAGIQPFQNLPTLAAIKDLGGDSTAFARRYNVNGLEAIERLAEEGSRFLVGDTPTFADICLIPQLYSARRFGVELAAMPTLLRIEAACNELPAFTAAHPDRQPGRAEAIEERHGPSSRLSASSGSSRSSTTCTSCRACAASSPSSSTSPRVGASLPQLDAEGQQRSVAFQAGECIILLLRSRTARAGARGAGCRSTPRASARSCTRSRTSRRRSASSIHAAAR